MFLDFYGLREQPFGVTPDPSYLYLGPSHRKAMDALLCGIDADQRFQALIAEPGMGKTTLVLQLLEKLQPTSRTIFLTQTQCNSRGLLHDLLSNLGIDTIDLDIVTMRHNLDEVLVWENNQGRQVVLVIDEAQSLDPSALETVWLLSEPEEPQAGKLQILLSGQPSLVVKLASPGLELLRQQVRNVQQLDRLSASETARYIEHRLRVAGYLGAPLFTRDALQLIAMRSRGIPRNINNICFNALATGHVLGRKNIDASIVEKALSCLDLGTIARKPQPPPRLPTISRQFPKPAAAAKGTFARGVLGTAAVAALSATLLVSGLITVSSSRRAWKFASHRPDPAVVSAAETPASSVSWPPKTEPAVAPVTPPPGETSPESISSQPVATRVEPSVPAAILRGAQARPRVAKKSPVHETITVVVRPQDNLRQICLRYFGQYRAEVVQQILELNSGVTDPNRLPIGLQLRLPRRYRGPRDSKGERMLKAAQARKP